MEELVRNLIAAIEADDTDTAMSYLADNFQFSGPVPQPIGAREWIGLQSTLKQAMPDWSFNLKDIRVEGNQAQLTIQITGTQSNDLDLTALGMGVIPATGIAVQLPEEYPVVTVEGDKITSLHADVTENGGVGGILKQLGVQPPAM